MGPISPLDPSRKFAYFAGGLGDVFRSAYREAAYAWLSSVEEPTAVLVASHNPFTVEIFRHHRNSKNFVILDLGHKFEELVGAGLRGVEVTERICSFAGLARRGAVRGSAPKDFKPVFDAPDNVESDGHIVLQPFAGATDARSWRPDFLETVVAALRRQPRRVYVVTRGYPRRRADGRAVHGAEDARRFAGGNIEVLENLSVPASLNLVRRSAGYVGSWSSLHQAAWLEGKPVAVFYPKNFVDVVNRTGYAFGLDRPDCLHADYSGFSVEALEAWLRNPVTRPGPGPVERLARWLNG